MEAEITPDGFLNIKRSHGGRVRAQCPFSASFANCGDWCPLFHEVKDAQSGQMIVELECCGSGRTWYKILEDTRVPLTSGSGQTENPKA